MVHFVFFLLPPPLHSLLTLMLFPTHSVPPPHSVFPSAFLKCLPRPPHTSCLWWGQSYTPHNSYYTICTHVPKMWYFMWHGFPLECSMKALGLLHTNMACTGSARIRTGLKIVPQLWKSVLPKAKTCFMCLLTAAHFSYKHLLERLSFISNKQIS